jgi:hypothetical protein
MLLGPNHWYLNMPGRIPDFGPMNEHLVRDLGCVFVLIAVVSLKGAFDRDWRRNALFINQLWFLPHAIIHLFDTLRGLVAIEHLYMDIPLCYTPPILIAVMQYVYKSENVKKEGSSESI